MLFFECSFEKNHHAISPIVLKDWKKLTQFFLRKMDYLDVQFLMFYLRDIFCLHRRLFLKLKDTLELWLHMLNKFCNIFANIMEYYGSYIDLIWGLTSS